VKTQIRVAAMLAAAAASVAVAGTALAHGKPSGHAKKQNTECNVSMACGNLSRDLNNNLNHNLDKNKLDVLSGNLNNNNVLSGDNVNVPVTIDASCNAVSAIASESSAVCLGNFHRITAGQNSGGQNEEGQQAPTAPAPRPHPVARAAVTG
jgi:hypothetical protein